MNKHDYGALPQQLVKGWRLAFWISCKVHIHQTFGTSFCFEDSIIVLMAICRPEFKTYNCKGFISLIRLSAYSQDEVPKENLERILCGYDINKALDSVRDRDELRQSIIWDDSTAGKSCLPAKSSLMLSCKLRQDSGAASAGVWSSCCSPSWLLAALSTSSTSCG